ncbi:MAG: thioredoxin fold domain-containing protein [Gammaproteobacteria bacterium]|nr:thioredoxin fold domain-containing protein [Gammaproteobacteria bacterium]
MPIFNADFHKVSVPLKHVLQFMLLIGFCLTTVADSDVTGDLTAFKERLQNSVAWKSMGVQISDLQTSPMPGFYTVLLTSGEVVYVDESVNFVVGEMLIELTDDEAIHHTNAFKKDYRKKVLAEADLPTLNYSPPDGTKYIAYVFTDTSCGYCRQLHQEMEGYHDLGVEIRYIFWARAGIQSKPHEEMVSAWCAQNPHKALDLLKQGRSIPQKSCKNRLEQNYNVVRQLGLDGTPAIVLEDGTLIGGYVTPPNLLRHIDTSS